jgi:hypothetical protein
MFNCTKSPGTVNCPPGLSRWTSANKCWTAPLIRPKKEEISCAALFSNLEHDLRIDRINRIKRRNEKGVDIF